MSNGRPEMEIGGGRLDVCYAAECDPNTNADFWDVKCRAFGGDDGTVFIPLDAVESVLRICQKALVIDLTPRSYQLLADR